MKFTITFKDPDGVYESLDAAAKESVNDKSLLPAERKALVAARRVTLDAAIKPWVEYGEYLNVEIDTAAGTATVLKVRP
jgi:hypothetical protein